jgi:hypothetical protein
MKLDLEPRLPTDGGMDRLVTRLYEVLRLVAQANNRRADGYVMAGVVQSANYTMQQGDSVVFMSAAAGARTVTLPAAAAAAGKLIAVRKTDTSANNVTLQAAAGQINGAATLVLTTASPAAQLVSDGSNYFTV